MLVLHMAGVPSVPLLHCGQVRVYEEIRDVGLRRRDAEVVALALDDDPGAGAACGLGGGPMDGILVAWPLLPLPGGEETCELLIGAPRGCASISVAAVNATLPRMPLAQHPVASPNVDMGASNGESADGPWEAYMTHACSGSPRRARCARRARATSSSA